MRVVTLEVWDSERVGFVLRFPLPSTTCGRFQSLKSPETLKTRVSGTQQVHRQDCSQRDLSAPHHILESRSFSDCAHFSSSLRTPTSPNETV